MVTAKFPPCGPVGLVVVVVEDWVVEYELPQEPASIIPTMITDNKARYISFFIYPSPHPFKERVPRYFFVRLAGRQSCLWHLPRIRGKRIILYPDMEVVLLQPGRADVWNAFRCLITAPGYCSQHPRQQQQYKPSTCFQVLFFSTPATSSGYCLPGLF
jgi:hypothetical protein